MPQETKLFAKKLKAHLAKDKIQKNFSKLSYAINIKILFQGRKPIDNLASGNALVLFQRYKRFPMNKTRGNFCHIPVQYKEIWKKSGAESWCMNEVLGRFGQRTCYQVLMDEYKNIVFMGN